MNQIIQVPFNNNDNKNNIDNSITNTTNINKKKKLKVILKIQLYISLFLIIIIGSLLINNSINLYKHEQYSNQILSNYNITRVYANLYSNDKENENNEIENAQDSYVIGIIEIPNINIYYPIFSNYTDELLKVSPCRIYGPLPGKNGNLCIAGHNYDNDKFFSKIMNLNLNDEIIIYNNKNIKFSYFVYDIYEVTPDDISPIYDYNKNEKQLTLITCNNLNNNRVIVKAILEN